MHSNGISVLLRQSKQYPATIFITIDFNMKEEERERKNGNG